MANRNVKMSKLKRAFQMLASNTPQRDICTQLHMGRGVLARYKKAADEKKLSYITASCMSEEELSKFLKSIKQDPVATRQRKELTELLPDYVSELYHNRYKTIQKLHEDYKKDNPDGYGYTQFKKAIREYQYANNLSYHNTYVPGREMQIDFAGDSLWLTNPKIGERTDYIGDATLADAIMDRLVANANKIELKGYGKLCIKKDKAIGWEIENQSLKKGKTHLWLGIPTAKDEQYAKVIYCINLYLSSG